MSRKHIGSSFDDFLAEEGLLDEATAVAQKRVLLWQLAERRAEKTDSGKRLRID